MKLLAAVRIRGIVNVNCHIRETMKLLRLTRANHCVLVPDTPQFMGMLRKAKDYITWGEISPRTVKEMIIKRGRLMGDRPITPGYIKDSTEFADIGELTKALADVKVLYKQLPDIKPIFRLAPPVKGYEGVKRSFTNGGALGYRGKKINDLLRRMM